jgi:hypothetical protein
MPCYTPDPTEEEMNAWGDLSPQQMEAMLCAFARAHGLDGVDYGEAGVSSALFRKWWEKHRAHDAKRARG